MVRTCKEDYLSRVTPELQWRGDFAAPVDASTSDVFGSQRIFNGVAQRPHLGLDFRVHTGTPVAAMNDGTVLLERPVEAGDIFRARTVLEA